MFILAEGVADRWVVQVAGFDAALSETLERCEVAMSVSTVCLSCNKKYSLGKVLVVDGNLVDLTGPSPVTRKREDLPGDEGEEGDVAEGADFEGHMHPVDVVEEVLNTMKHAGAQ